MSEVYFYYGSEDPLLPDLSPREVFANCPRYVKKSRIIQEALAPNTPALARPGLSRILEAMTERSTIYFMSLDCLGHNIRDILNTLNKIHGLDGRAICLAISPRIDLNSDRGRPLIAAMASYAYISTSARSRLVLEGQARARKRGQPPGRNIEISQEAKKIIRDLINSGHAVSVAAKATGNDRGKVYRLIKREGLTLNKAPKTTALVESTPRIAKVN